MSEPSDYSPGTWAGHDFGAAREAYDKSAGRSYMTAKIEKKETADLIPSFVETLCENPFVVITDETGSMGRWPAVIFSKLPYLDHEIRTEYSGHNVEISFAAIGDAYNGEDYPMQAQSFASGIALKDALTKLVIEGLGGTGDRESYEIAALYYARNCRMPNAVRPIIVFIGDERTYDSITPDMAKKYTRVSLQQKISTKEVFDELRRKFSVYFIQKPSNSGEDHTQIVRNHWSHLVGDDHIALLPDADRVVDVIFGILAKEFRKIDYFRKELEDRQKPEQVKMVYESLSTIHALPESTAPESKKLLTPGGSTLHKSLGETSPKRLLP